MPAASSRSLDASSLVAVELVSGNGRDDLRCARGVKFQHVEWLIDIVMVVEVQGSACALVVDFLPRFQVLVSNRVVRNHASWWVGDRFHLRPNRIPLSRTGCVSRERKQHKTIVTVVGQ